MNINPLDIMKQMGAFQEKLTAINALGSAGGGMVEIELNGKFEVTAVRITPQAIEDGDTEMLSDLIMAAFSNALEKTREAIAQEAGVMAGGIPGLSGLMGAL
jgi:DNA-binding YbaB/EbfC family protein